MKKKPAGLYIARLYSGDDSTVRIDVKDGAKLLCRIDVDLERFIRAVMGEACVDALFSDERE